MYLYFYILLYLLRLTIATVEIRNVSCVLALPKLTSAISFGGRERAVFKVTWNFYYIPRICNCELLLRRKILVSLIANGQRVFRSSNYAISRITSDMTARHGWKLSFELSSQRCCWRSDPSRERRWNLWRASRKFVACVAQRMKTRVTEVVRERKVRLRRA